MALAGCAACDRDPGWCCRPCRRERMASLDENRLLAAAERSPPGRRATRIRASVTDAAMRAAPRTIRSLERCRTLGVLGRGGRAGAARPRLSPIAASTPSLRARNRVERIVLGVLFACSCIAVLTTVGIMLSLLFESLRFFAQVPLTEFLFGLQWSPQTAMRADQVGSSGAFGAVPLFAGTLLITVDRHAGRRCRSGCSRDLPVGVRQPALARRGQADAGDPGRHPDRGLRLLRRADRRAPHPRARRVGRPRRRLGKRARRRPGHGHHDHPVRLVAVRRRHQRRAAVACATASYALGATRAETITQVLLPAALPGIIGGVLLAVSRAIGETMIVVMAAGPRRQPDRQPAARR